jgi:protoporphyrinogen oxidase
VRVAVIGAGMVGLVSALRLCLSGASVTVFERDARVGGLAASFEPGGIGDSLERFYHHVFRTDALFAALCTELGLADDLVWASPNTSCYYDGEYRQLDSPASLLRFTALPLLDRLRLAGALAFLKAVPDPAFLERWSATAWLKRTAGAAAYRIVFEPLFVSKFGRHADSISLAWFWARIHDRTADLGYVRGGFDRVYRGLAARIDSLGGKIVFGATVRGISRTASGLDVSVEEPEGARTSEFDVVISTLPLRNTSRFADFPPAFIEAHGKTEFLMARCVVLALDRSLTGRYWVNVCDPDVPFMVVVEHTQLVSSERYGNKHIVYLGNYGESFPACETATLIEQFTPYLRRLNPEFSPDWITDQWQFVAPGAQPVITPGYRDRMPPVETPLPGLFLANLEQVYPHDRGQNYAIELAEMVSAKILSKAN